MKTYIGTKLIKAKSLNLGEYNILKGWRVSHPNEPAFLLPECLAEKVAKNEFGRKSGKGFYIWEGDKVVKPNDA